jgi:hypothetical protein
MHATALPLPLSLSTPDRAALEAFLGIKIKLCPPARGTCLSAADILNRLSYAPLRDDLTVISYVNHRRRYKTKRALCPSPVYDKFTLGRSVSTLMRMGVTRQLINRAVKERWVRFKLRRVK